LENGNPQHSISGRPQRSPHTGRAAAGQVRRVCLDALLKALLTGGFEQGAHPDRPEPAPQHGARPRQRAGSSRGLLWGAQHDDRRTGSARQPYCALAARHPQDRVQDHTVVAGIAGVAVRAPGAHAGVQLDVAVHATAVVACQHGIVEVWTGAAATPALVQHGERGVIFGVQTLSAPGARRPQRHQFRLMLQHRRPSSPVRRSIRERYVAASAWRKQACTGARLTCQRPPWHAQLGRSDRARNGKIERMTDGDCTGAHGGAGSASRTGDTSAGRDLPARDTIARNAPLLRSVGILPEDDHPPFDIIGDVHGCIEELRELLDRLGYVAEGEGYRHPQGRRAVYVGDLVDRGPGVVPVLRTAVAMRESGVGLVVIGNHDGKFLRWLRGWPVRIRYGLGGTIAELTALPATEREQLAAWSEALLAHAPGYLVLDSARLVVTHGAIRDGMIGRWNDSIAGFCMYGDVAGYTTSGKPIRRDWGAARDLSAPGGEHAPRIVYGHNVVEQAEWVNRTIDIDTGCVYGGALTALRYPELDLVRVAARSTYATRGE
jgi:diadenosine tetraphosphatase ApaH/serine/threonine PP2A family protein phosphatase